MGTYDFYSNGFTIQANLLSKDLITAVIEELSYKQNRLPMHGLRNADKKFQLINKIANSDPLISTANQLLGRPCQAVRTILFDKTAEKNWLVSWHQDKTVAVTRAFDAPGWGPWSFKDHTHHVQPPVEALKQMLTIRLHLDKTDETNGCLKVIPNSHTNGILNTQQIQDITHKESAFSCCANVGDAVIMHPLLLHASSKARLPTHRRIIHIEYSCYQLPNGVCWA